jgi:hypothetical protein
MAENNDTSVQAEQAKEFAHMVQTGSIQTVQTDSKSLSEGYQPLPIERKGYQAIETPLLSHRHRV